MPNLTTKSFGIRIPIELHAWLHGYMKSTKLNRNQCICKLLTIAKNRVTAKPVAKPKVIKEEPKKEEVKHPGSTNLMWVGVAASVVVVTLDIEFMLGVINMNHNTLFVYVWGQWILPCII